MYVQAKAAATTSEADDQESLPEKKEVTEKRATRKVCKVTPLKNRNSGCRDVVSGHWFVNTTTSQRYIFQAKETASEAIDAQKESSDKDEEVVEKRAKRKVGTYIFSHYTSELCGTGLVVSQP